MRLLILSNLYPPNVVGGYERLCFEVTTALAARGHDVTVLTSRHGGQLADYPGQRILREWQLLAGADIYAPFTGDRDPINQHNRAVLERVLAEARPDVVFAWNLFFLDASLLGALQASRVRTVLMLTDNWLLTMRNPQFWTEFWARHVLGDASFAPPPVRAPLPWPKRLAARLLRRPLGLEAIFGAGFVRDLYAAGGLRFPIHRVIHNGVHQAGYAGLPTPDRTRLVQPGTLRLLFAGRMVDLKAPDTCVQALDHLHLDGLRVELTLLGDTQDQAFMGRLHGVIAASGRAEQITLRPSVPEAALPDLFAEHDIYLFPSLYEPFSLTLIHAMALGIPTVASRVGGNAEILTDGQSGLMFTKGDAAGLAACVRRLAQDGELRQHVASGGRVAAQAFTFERMVDEMAAFLGRAV